MHKNGFVGRLRRLDYLKSECQLQQLISDDVSAHSSDAYGGLRLRISRLRKNDNLEKAARNILKHLRDLKPPYLIAAYKM